MSESKIQTDIMKAIHPFVAWAFVTTTGRVKGRGGHWITLGYPGMADIIGQLKDGRTLAIEVKVPGEEPTDVQREFLRLIDAHHGVSGWATCIDHALQIVRAEHGTP